MKCKIDGCTSQAITDRGRGLCLVCLTRVEKLIQERKTSWEELNRLDLAFDPPQVQGLVEKSLEERRKKWNSADSSRKF